MARKEVEESHNQTDVRYIRNHPKHDRFPVRRLGLAALLIAVAMILLVVLPLPWPTQWLEENPRLALPMQKSLGSTSRVRSIGVLSGQ